MEEKFRKSVLDFMEQNAWTWYKLAKSIEYSSEKRLKEYFTTGKGSISLSTAAKIAYIIDEHE